MDAIVARGTARWWLTASRVARWLTRVSLLCGLYGLAALSMVALVGASVVVPGLLLVGERAAASLDVGPSQLVVFPSSFLGLFVMTAVVLKAVDQAESKLRTSTREPQRVTRERGGALSMCASVSSRIGRLSLARLRSDGRTSSTPRDM